MFRKFAVAGLLTAFTTGSAIGQEPDAWVVDRLSIPVYARADPGSTIVGTIETGTPVTVLERQLGFVKITGAIPLAGWIESVYVTDERPGRFAVTQSRGERGEANARAQAEELAKAEGELRATEQELEAAASRESRLESDNQALEREVARLRAERMLLESRLEALLPGAGSLPAKTPLSASAAFDTEDEAPPPAARTGLGAMDGISLSGMLLVGFTALAFFIAGVAASRFGLISRPGTRRTIVRPDQRTRV